MAPSMQVLHGLAASAGIAIGRAVCLQSRIGDIYRFPIQEEDLEREIERFRAAVARVKSEIGRLRGRVDEAFGNELAAIFEAHHLFLEDHAFVDRVEDRIRQEGVNAEWALYETTEELDQQFGELKDAYLRERKDDLQDVSRQLQRTLQGIDHHELSEIAGDVVIVADDLTPADAVRLGREQVVGFVVEGGGTTSHTSIIARSLKLPAVINARGASQQLTNADPVVVDGEQGLVILHPTPTTLEEYRRRQEELKRHDQAVLRESRGLPCRTVDGVSIHLMANIDLPEELEDIARFGAEGVGIYRSEFLYIEKSPELPSEEEHLAIYRRILEAAAPHPALIRTYDLGGKRLARELMEVQEDNPVLGLRGIRLTLARPDIFKTQVRALLQAGQFGNLWLMLPLVTTVDEVRRFRALLAEVQEELRATATPYQEDFKLGIMVEVPAAALTADALAPEVDFFAIGTNDLIQYAMAVDRNNEHVAELFQPLHPAILRMLRFVINSAGEAGIDVSLCGEVAGDVRLTALLLGLGLRRLSMGPSRIPAVKKAVRSLSAQELREVAERACKLASAAEVERYLAEHYPVGAGA